ncbi:transmembrane protein, putative (macronuclear) [Tetrahymena thermophila SB210]|uniref:Transmembrane protein, putative n=1 Tax=Tetrahymena thermophila (strain SB210) TaxID=312017 RepID=W7XGL9_TETTS|nr:transmembrane protein, putative [Tetrahymena thermophila SB210]EWS76183.1 transmembrane protein, putative [Tetrahymena thermophila SB210]|eukprot:XP_012651230.1 transmembrane protein, putative [Tetrahymena thermophila SB210]
MFSQNPKQINLRNTHKKKNLEFREYYLKSNNQYCCHKFFKIYFLKTDKNKLFLISCKMRKQIEMNQIQLIKQQKIYNYYNMLRSQTMDYYTEKKRLRNDELNINLQNIVNIQEIKPLILYIQRKTIILIDYIYIFLVLYKYLLIIINFIQLIQQHQLKWLQLLKKLNKIQLKKIKNISNFQKQNNVMQLINLKFFLINVTYQIIFKRNTYYFSKRVLIFTSCQLQKVNSIFEIFQLNIKIQIKKKINKNRDQ